ncbi:hypothetical protein [Planctomicrobium sp. SH527]|uniref:hypothetical protein n=1 Tax=Planctomicrobium sp. SH527 TaxID=3448123 RepID=UPI003F5C9EB7
MKSLFTAVLATFLMLNSPTGISVSRSADLPVGAEILNLDNLVAWCIVPFDAKKRSPQQRAEMLRELGIRSCAYDWRAEHVPTFEEEIRQYKANGIEMFAFWGEHPHAFELFEKYNLHPQIWQMPPNPAGETDEAKIAAAVEALTPLAKKTQAMKCPLGLYNHGNWGGEPKNLVAVCEALRKQGFNHVGIVYNFHHGHSHITDWQESFTLMKPYLLCLNINGMNASGTPKILYVGQGEHETNMLRVVIESNYSGRIGILNHHVDIDAREALTHNMLGTKSIKTQLTK